MIKLVKPQPAIHNHNYAPMPTCMKLAFQCPCLLTNHASQHIHVDRSIPNYPPCLALYPRRRALSGLVGLGARWRLESWRYCQHRTRSKNRITSDCFFLHNSCIYLYAPMLYQLQKEEETIHMMLKHTRVLETTERGTLEKFLPKSPTA